MVGRFTCSATHTGKWRGHAATGRRFENVDEVYFFRFDDGRIAEAWEFRTYAHPPAAMLDVCRASGLRPRYAHAGVVWQVEGLNR